MSNSISNEITETVEDTLDVVARRCAKPPSALRISQRTRVKSCRMQPQMWCASLRSSASMRSISAKDVARQATHEVREHPIAIARCRPYRRCSFGGRVCRYAKQEPSSQVSLYSEPGEVLDGGM